MFIIYCIAVNILSTKKNARLWNIWLPKQCFLCHVEMQTKRELMNYKNERRVAQILPNLNENNPEEGERIKAFVTRNELSFRSQPCTGDKGPFLWQTGQDKYLRRRGRPEDAIGSKIIPIKKCLNGNHGNLVNANQGFYPKLFCLFLCFSAQLHCWLNAILCVVCKLILALHTSIGLSENRNDFWQS